MGSLPLSNMRSRTTAQQLRAAAPSASPLAGFPACSSQRARQALQQSSRSSASGPSSSSSSGSWQSQASDRQGCAAAAAAPGRSDWRTRAAESSTAERTAAVGDTVTVHFAVIGEGGEQLESSRAAGQPLTFEVGASDVVGNELLALFDGGVRGLAVGATRRVQLEPLQEEWDEALLFNVPGDHPEVARLQGKFRSAGGLQEGQIVELANGAQAQVLKITAEGGLVLDANSATAGRKIAFDLELVQIE